MALPTSGTISASMIQKELKESGSWSINSPTSRKLAKVPSGTIKFTDFYGKAVSETVNEYVLYKNSWSFSVNSWRDIRNVKNFNFQFNIPKNIVSGEIKVKVDFPTSAENYGNPSLLTVDGFGTVKFDKSSETKFLSKKFNNFNASTINGEGRLGVLYRQESQDSGYTYHFALTVMNVLITFTGEWEPNNLYYKLLDYFSSFFKEVRNICQSL